MVICIVVSQIMVFFCLFLGTFDWEGHIGRNWGCLTQGNDQCTRSSKSETKCNRIQFPRSPHHLLLHTLQLQLDDDDELQHHEQVPVRGRYCNHTVAPIQPKSACTNVRSTKVPLVSKFLATKSGRLTFIISQVSGRSLCSLVLEVYSTTSPPNFKCLAVLVAPCARVRECPFSCSGSLLPKAANQRRFLYYSATCFGVPLLFLCVVLGFDMEVAKEKLELQ